MAFHKCCGPGTLFDDVILDCDFDYNVDCGSRPKPGETTTTTTKEPTTTTTVATTTTTITTTSITATPPPSTTTTLISTTTTSMMTSTTSWINNYPGFPNRVLGMYILLADNFEEGFETGADWEPMLYPYQQAAANVLYFTFIDPASMEVPRSFQKLAQTKGTYKEGAVPADTLIFFAIGGYAYSQDPNPWKWLLSQEAAEEKAKEVAHWRDDYGIDGIDLDIEAGAGSHPDAGGNLLHFIRQLKSIHPDLLISQPTYGYPQIAAEIDVINGSWMPGGASTGYADNIGIMLYEGILSLDYVDNYASGSSQGEGFPISVDVPTRSILVGSRGSNSAENIEYMAMECLSRDLQGIMVWYASVRNGLQYEPDWDATNQTASEQAYVAARELFESGMMSD